MPDESYDAVAAAVREAAAQMTRTVGLAMYRDTPLEALSPDQIRAVVRGVVLGTAVRLAASDHQFDADRFIDAAGCGELAPHLADMRRRYEAGGITVAQLAEQMGLQPADVRDQLHDLGVRLGHRPRPPAPIEALNDHPGGVASPRARGAQTSPQHPAELARAFDAPAAAGAQPDASHVAATPTRGHRPRQPAQTTPANRRP